MRIDCEGAPRDLGFDQGRVLGEGVDAELVRILRSRPPDAALTALARDVERHFPHLAERMTGLARGAHVERKALVVALARASSEPEFLFRPARAVARRGEAGRPALLAARFDLGADRCSVPLVRRSLPHGGFESLELTLPWLAASLGGVNAVGLAACLGPAAPPAGAPAEDGGDEPCRAPGLFLVQQCLERFDRVAPALDWCRTRPAYGVMTLLLADETGATAVLAFEGEGRRVLVPAPDGSFFLAPPAAAGSALVKADAGDVEAFAALLRDGDGGDPLAHRAFLALDPAARSLAVLQDREGLVTEPRAERFRLEPAQGG